MSSLYDKPMHKHDMAAGLLAALDLGSSIAELDTLLEAARVETSAFTDMYLDKVDLVPGTKGSGKSALFRMFVDFLPGQLLKLRKVVVAHGVQKQGDHVFLAFHDEFNCLDEDDFVSFWCIYFTSLAHEQFIKGPAYQVYLENATAEVRAFREACENARIPDIKAPMSLKGILAWTLGVLQTWRPKLRYKLPQDAGTLEVDLFGQACEVQTEVAAPQGKLDVPVYVDKLKESLEAVLSKTDLSVWLMLDRLDEVFLRRSPLEARALRGLLRAMRLFSTPAIRVKVFLRDDMLEQLVAADTGFTALTHMTARQADTLRWPEDQILTMLVKRLFAHEALREYLQVDKARLDANAEYRLECFYKVFPATVHGGPNQSPTLKWMYNHTMDGRRVVTPRDILDLVTRAKQAQQDKFRLTPDAHSPWLIGSEAILYGLEELSKRKRDTYLRAEFPHLWPQIEKFRGGKAEYTPKALRALLGPDWEKTCKDLEAIGLLTRAKSQGEETYWFPFVYRGGLDLTQGRAS